MPSLPFDKVLFFVSALVLAFCYGYASRHAGLFPNQLIQQAQKEASSMWYRPSLSRPVHDRDRTGIHWGDSTAVQPGLLFVNSLWNDGTAWNPGFELVNRHGQTLHRWRVDRSRLFPDSVGRRGDPENKLLHGSHLMPNGDVLFNVDYVGTVRINACGDVLWQLPRGNHHAIARADDGSFWIPGLAAAATTRTEHYPEGLPGLDDPVWLDEIQHVSPDGQVIKTFTLLDVLYRNNLERYIAKAFHPQTSSSPPRTKDITHMNDVEPLSSSIADTYPLFEAGDLLISVRQLDLVFVMDPATQRVKWHGTKPLIQQHDPDFIGDGWIGVFDNNRDFTDRGTMLGGNRIVAFQPYTDSVTVRFPTPASDPFYTDTMGKWQPLDNGNMLLTESKSGRIVEVAPNGRTVWEWILEPYSTSRVARISQATQHDLTQAEVATWPCASVDL